MEMRKTPEGLRTLILSSIKAAEYRRARLYLLISGVTLSVSVIGLVFAIKYLIQTLYASEFYSYVTLIYSDKDMVLGFWKDILLSLAESFPVFVIVAVLVSILVFLASMQVIVENFKMALTPRLSI
ncbi:MAG: hypothetical protein ABL917_01565 [Parcubacteria group bacterium]